jgi:UDP-N-acetyl-D-mannosaminuronic acid dehydrogenase
MVSRLEQRFPLSELSIGILGMAFKGGSDDTRSSLSYKLKRILRFKARAVLCTDPYVNTDSDLLPLDDVLKGSDLLIVAAPHLAYRDLDVKVPIINIWGADGERTQL